jgi:hypothetical protein
VAELHAAAHAVDACAADPEASAKTELPAISPSAEPAIRAERRIRLPICMDPPGARGIEAIWRIAFAGDLGQFLCPESQAVNIYL